MASQLAFALFSLVVIVAAWRVVTTENVMRAALALVIVLGAMAPLFIMLAAEFVAAVQVLVYVGAVVILFLFAVMLTRSPMTKSEAFDNQLRWPGFAIAAALFLVLWLAIRNAVGDEKLKPTSVIRTSDVGKVLISDHVIAFEAVSVLLLAALIGAIVLARRDPEEDA